MKIKIAIAIIAIVIAFLLFANYIDTDKTVVFNQNQDKLTLDEMLGFLSENELESIKNIDNPKVEEMVFNKEPSIYLFDKNTKLKGRKVIKYTYNTTQDGLLGPITFYVDKETGFVLGSDFRE